MTRDHLILWALAAVLLFWAVGAHNRLVRLRSEVVRSFEPLHEQLTQRHTLLQLLLEALAGAPALASATDRLEALRAASLQAEAAGAHARQRPGATGAITSLRLAEDILSEARSRLPVHALPGADLAELNTRLGAVDSALAYARRRFNEAVEAYNDAVHQFPTRLIAAVFGLRQAATL